MPSSSGRLARTGGLTPALLALGATLLLAGCGEGSSVLNPHGVGAKDIVGLWWIIFWMAVGVFIVVEGILVIAIFRFRAREGAPLPRQVQGNTPLEVAWTILPTVVLLGVLIATFTTMKAVASPAPQALQINVIGHQWWWEFDYPAQGIQTADELHLPVNQNVTFHVMSADVVHNFWVPELDRKVQALPGHDNLIPVMATDVGTYQGFCAEFCGLEHALMRFDVIVQSPSDFAAWVAGQQAPPALPTTAAEKAGQADFSQSGCSICHQIGSAKPAGYPYNGETIVGPNLSHFASRGILAGDALTNTPQNVSTWLHEPNTVKPGNMMTAFIHNGQLPPQQVQDLTAYLESLK